MLSLSVYDVLVIIIYFAGLIFISCYKYKKPDNEEQFILSGRRLTTLPLLATLVSTWYGGIFGIGEYSYLYGISTFLVFGVPFYLFSALYAVFLVPRIRKLTHLSLPEAAGLSYGTTTKILSAIAIIVLVSPAPYILMLAQLFETIFHYQFNYITMAIMVTTFSLIYIFFGGFGTVIKTDIIQVCLMFLGFGLVLAYAISDYGNPITLWQKLSPTHTHPTGKQPFNYILVWFFIALWTFIDPSFHQRISAAKSSSTGKKAIYWSILCWFIFDTITIATGLYGITILGNIDNPTMVYPLLADHVLPVGLKGLFLVAILATIMSTLDSYLFLSGSTVGRDIIQPFFPKYKVNFLIQCGMVLSAFFSIILTLLVPSVVGLWYTIGSMIVPGLLIPILGIYFPFFKIKNRKWVTYTMIFPILASASGFILNTFKITSIEPFYLGFALSIILLLIDKNQIFKYIGRIFRKNILYQNNQ